MPARQLVISWEPEIGKTNVTWAGMDEIQALGLLSFHQFGIARQLTSNVPHRPPTFEDPAQISVRSPALARRVDG
jgi:hypothetical protein